MGKAPKKSRWDRSLNFAAKKTAYKSVQGFTRTYDSKAEAKRASELDMMLRAGDIHWWIPQVPFPLPGGVVYRVDFMISNKLYRDSVEIDGQLIAFEDVKGRITPVSKMKIKQVEEIYGIEIEIVS